MCRDSTRGFWFPSSKCGSSWRNSASSYWEVGDMASFFTVSYAYSSILYATISDIFLRIWRYIRMPGLKNFDSWQIWFVASWNIVPADPTRLVDALLSTLGESLLCSVALICSWWDSKRKVKWVQCFLLSCIGNSLTLGKGFIREQWRKWRTDARMALLVVMSDVYSRCSID